ncbi:hypothetical protein FRC10_003092 [Ceratobasidium sp. 414]|nr:hypothetical protein FRC10_003092 [Ceratobasidium sp. 414]
MLGRLRMSVDEAMECFSEIVSQVFSKKKLWGEGSYKATILEKIVGQMVSKYAGSVDARMWDDAVNDEGCKTIVCATSIHSVGDITLFRSYRSWRNEAPDCTIIQAVRATTARPGLFKPVEIEENHIKLPFADAGLGCNNPTALMLEEVSSIFPEREVGCVISVGTGQAQVVSIPKSRRISWNSSKDSIMALQRIATDCEQTAQVIEKRFLDTPNIYFRFNVEQGLQDTGMAELGRLPEIAAHARHYNQIIDSKLKRAVHAVVSADALVPAAQLGICGTASHTNPTHTMHLGGAIVPALPNVQMKPCPPPSIYFTGQNTVLTQIKEYFVDGSSARHVFVLHGLGGSGKTQIALKFVEQYRDCFWDIFYADASSAETISADLKRIAISRKAGSAEGDALTWLAGQDEKWLVVFNNADNTSLDLKRYFPACSHGDILITTRNRQNISIAGETKPGAKAECYVSGMEPEDARELLLKVSDVDSVTGEHAAILVKEFGYLALAIIQAGAYIRVTQCSLEEYLAMYRKNKTVLEEYNKLPKCDDYQWTVYTTWYTSYERLEPRFAQFLRLLGYMHHEGITEDIFQNACERLSAYRSELSTDEDKVLKQGVTEFLQSSFYTEYNSFDKLAFLDFIRELRSYSLIDFNPFDRTYSFHSLLQDWVRRIDGANSSTALSSTTLLLALSVRYDCNPGLCPCSQKSLLPHIDAVLSNSNVMPCTANSFAWVYQQNQLWETAEPLLRVSLEASEHLLGKTHPTTLYNIENLATTVSHQGRWPEAEALRSEAAKACEQRLGTDHAHTLWAMSNLALHYSKQGQFQKTEDLQHRIIDAKRRTVGESHTETLQAIGNLAVTCANSDQLEKAEWMQQLILNCLKKLAGPQHPITLTSKQHLALTYARQKKWGKFKALQADIVHTRSTVLGKEHYDTGESVAILDWFNQNIRIPNSPPIIRYLKQAKIQHPKANQIVSATVSAKTVSRDLKKPRQPVIAPAAGILRMGGNSSEGLKIRMTHGQQYFLTVNRTNARAVGARATAAGGGG